MKTFKLSAQVTISIYTEVEAETLEDAIDIASGKHIEMANNSSSKEQFEDAWVCDEFDGEPVEIREA